MNEKINKKECYKCKYSGMDMDMDPYCFHPNTQINFPYGLVLKSPKINDICNIITKPLFEKRDND